MEKRNIIIKAAGIGSLLFFLHAGLSGQTSLTKPYGIDVTGPGKKIVSGNLDAGGTNLRGDSYEVNNFYFLRNNNPFIPVTGEFHYSRYPHKYWEESIRKMKAGGINIIATYVFWNIHEEYEGTFDWEGDKNLRSFIELCAKNDMPVIVRIGPYCHGEIRNGGLPDWLFGRPFNVRSNDPAYLEYVERLYTETGKQLRGLLFKDNGPVIGVQLENEYQHSASPWALTYPGQPADWTVAESDRPVIKEGVSVADVFNPYEKLGREHMRVLKALAEKAGLIVPFITATGWGNAAIIENESIPVTAAYPYPSWIPGSSLSDFFLYTDLQENPDYSPVSYNPRDYPYFPAEIGGGMCNNYHRRLTVPAESLDALINRFLGSGSNGLGYYMFHGGATPRGDQYFFSDEAYAYPKINYDYQAPIGQYGQVNPSFHRLKLIHFFLNSFGDRLACMSLYLPASHSGITASDTSFLRYSVRSDGNSGFVFLNNFQDHLEIPDKTGIRISVRTSTEAITIPETGGFTLKGSENLILPFNFDLGGVKLNYATAQLLTTAGDEKNPHFIFFVTEGLTPEFSVSRSNVSGISGESCQLVSDNKRWLIRCPAQSEFTISRKSGGEIKILVLEKSMALESWIFHRAEKKYLAFTDAVLLDKGDSVEFIKPGSPSFSLTVYPGLPSKPSLDRGTLTSISGEKSILREYRIDLTMEKFELKTEKIGENKLQLTFPPSLPPGVHDVFLKIDYTGDTGMSFMNGVLVDDHFYYGQPWIIGLKKFYDLPQHTMMLLYFRPFYSNAPYLGDLDQSRIPDFSETRSFLKLNNVEAIPEYRGIIKF